jgi:hypothetical protein
MPHKSSDKVLLDVQIECANRARAIVIRKAIRHIAKMEGAEYEICVYRPAPSLTVWDRICGWLGMTTYHREET